MAEKSACCVECWAMVSVMTSEVIGECAQNPSGVLLSGATKRCVCVCQWYTVRTASCGTAIITDLIGHNQQYKLREFHAQLTTKMNNVQLDDSAAISQRLKDCPQEIADFLTGITNNFCAIDFNEFCGYISIEPVHMSIKCVDGHTSSDNAETVRRKLIQFTIHLPISEGLLSFLSTAFRMIDETKIISLSFVGTDIDEKQLAMLQPFQKQLESQLYSICVHHVPRTHPETTTSAEQIPTYLSIVGWDSMRIVSLKNNGLNDSHCTAVCQIMQSNPNLTALLLDQNEITTPGFVELMSGIIDKMPSVLVLSFSYNSIDDQGLEELQALIQSSKNGLGNLQSLRLLYNRFSSERKQSLLQFMRDGQESKCTICL